MCADDVYGIKVSSRKSEEELLSVATELLVVLHKVKGIRPDIACWCGVRHKKILPGSERKEKRSETACLVNALHWC